MDMRIFRLKPLTPLLFRTPKPFDLGERADSLYYPPPSTIVGMVRSIICELKNISFDAVSLSKYSGFTGVYNLQNEFHSTYNFKWRLIGPYLLDGGNNVYYPLPMDVFVSESDQNIDVIMPHRESMDELKYLSGLDGGAIVDVITHENLLRNFLSRKIKRYSNMFIHIDDMQRILCSKYDGKKITNLRIIAINDIFINIEEPHIKLDRDYKTVEIREGKGLYFTTTKVMLRDKWSFIFGIVALKEEINEYFEHLDGKIAKFGGEGGLVEVQEVTGKVKFIENNYLKNLDQELPSNLRIILTSPALFEEGGKYLWYPPNLGTPKFYTIQETLVGGWDYLKNTPKPLCVGVNKGSVYCYELKKTLKFRQLITDRIHVPDNFKGAYGSLLIGEW